MGAPLAVRSGVLGAGPEAVSVAECQDGTVPSDSDVRIEGAVVTSPVTADGKGLFVQDEGGGAYSGIYVYLGNDSSESYAVGEKVDIEGQVIEYYDLTELSYVDIVKTGETAAAVASPLSAAPSDWEP